MFPDINISPVLIWSIIAVALIIIELLNFTFVLCFFGVGAFLVALTTWLRITTGFFSQLVAFALLSLILTFLLRKTAKKLFSGTNDKPPDYLGQRVRIIKTINPGNEGAVNYRGSDWIAFSDSAEIFKEGEMVEVVSMDGIRLKIERIKQN